MACFTAFLVQIDEERAGFQKGSFTLRIIFKLGDIYSLLPRVFSRQIEYFSSVCSGFGLNDVTKHTAKINIDST